MTRVLRSRALHYLVIGGFLFAARTTWSKAVDAVSRPRIVISAAQRGEIARELQQRPGRAPTGEEERAQLERAVDDAILYREAVARGLDRDDPVVRERVVQNMRLLSDDPQADEERLYREGLGLGLDRSDVVVRRHLATAMRLLTVAPVRLRAPSDAELAAALARDPDRFRLPGTTSITHVFVSRERTPHPEERAARIRDALRTSGVDPTDAPARGDPFPLGFRLADRTDADLDALFGAGFASAVAALPLGAWSGPTPSSYGLHLVWVHARVPGGLPSTDAIRSRLVERVYYLRGEERLREWLAAQRARYDIRVEEPRDAATVLRAAALAPGPSLPRPAAIVGD